MTIERISTWWTAPHVAAGSMSSCRGPGRRAFSLVELLVVVFVIAILLGMLVPAVQKVREWAARQKCQNNLKALGQGTHTYLATHKSLPPSGEYSFDGTATSQVSGWSALARLLPFIDQEAIFKGLDLTQHNRPSFLVSPSMYRPEITSQRVGAFLCPSEIQDAGSGTVYGAKNWPLNYAVNFGTFGVLRKYSTALAPGDGAFAAGCGFKQRDFVDGMSNTLGMSEVKAYTYVLIGNRSTRPFATKAPSGPPPLLAAPTATDGINASPPFGLPGVTVSAFDPTKFAHSEWATGMVHQTAFTTVFPPNKYVAYVSGGVAYDLDFVSTPETSYSNTYAAVTSRSYHVGVVNVLMMDGAVRSIGNDVSLATWRALGTRAGNDLPGEY